MTDESPLLDTVLEINAASLARADLDPQILMLVRLAALAAVDAPAASYLVNLGAAAETGLTLEDVRGVLIAVTPIVGTPKVITAARAVADALGIAVGLDEAINQD